MAAHVAKWEQKKQQTHGECAFTAQTLINVKPKVPKQKNSCDCGVFVLMYAEYFLSRFLRTCNEAGQLTAADVEQKMRRYLWEAMFDAAAVSKKRTEIDDTITGLQNAANTVELE